MWVNHPLELYMIWFRSYAHFIILKPQKIKISFTSSRFSFYYFLFSLFLFFLFKRNENLLKFKIFIVCLADRLAGLTFNEIIKISPDIHYVENYKPNSYHFIAFYNSDLPMEMYDTFCVFPNQPTHNRRTPSIQSLMIVISVWCTYNVFLVDWTNWAIK